MDLQNHYQLMSEPLPVDGFEWTEDLSKIDEDFINSYDENSDKGYILEVDVEYPKNLDDLHIDLPFLPERIKIDKSKKLVCNLYEPNYHTTKWFSETLLAIEMKKTKVKMNKPVYLGLLILEVSKTLIYEFWHDYMKPKYGDNVKLCYMDTDNFIMHIKTEYFYKDIASDVEKRFDISSYEVNRPLPAGKNKKVIGLTKDELGGRL